MEGASAPGAGAFDRLHRGRKTVGAFLMQGVSSHTFNIALYTYLSTK